MSQPITLHRMLSDERSAPLPEPLAVSMGRGWLLLAKLFDHPDAALIQAYASGRLRQQVLEIFTAIDPALVSALGENAFVGETDPDALASDYSRLFYLGERDTPLCSLHEGEHRGHRMEVMEEVLRFYKHFGLVIARSPNEMPDHLVSELEFLHFLSFQHARYQKHGQNGSAFQRAGADFLTRHAGRWMPDIHASLVAAGGHPLYQDASHLLALFVQRQLALGGANSIS
ncbi:molecular chaperone TorD family protein [Denitratisoma oestradiolicum]|uniref:Uncharacterized protein n=1 Tax=Denitratisoma oestradiolicum TaxID=311182 RepID=A0A6S6XTC3_9PROT|nr:molecular chaperone TorD family protein [Denitratisoma oestradiolicum]TWO82287.1 hypothetical protein CBW56_02260 [Denitratisoma oestradiolicum]CAB1369240.1 conserved protein of unknown function [Denitratisoma oestradiolicum]